MNNEHIDIQDSSEAVEPQVKWYLYDPETKEYTFTFSDQSLQPINSTPIEPSQELRAPMYWTGETWVDHDSAV